MGLRPAELLDDLLYEFTEKVHQICHIALRDKKYINTVEEGAKRVTHSICSVIYHGARG